MAGQSRTGKQFDETICLTEFFSTVAEILEKRLSMVFVDNGFMRPVEIVERFNRSVGFCRC